MEANSKKLKAEDHTTAALKYPSSEDIYNQDQKESDIDPEDISKNKTFEKTSKNNEKSFEEDVSGSDLDIPSDEFENSQAGIGNVDEENDFYSIGGDNHNDLEEDNG